MGQAPCRTLFRVTHLFSQQSSVVVGAVFTHNSSGTKRAGLVHTNSQFCNPASSTACPTIQFTSDTNHLELANPTSSRAQSHNTSLTADASCKYWVPRACTPPSDLSEPGIPTTIPSQNSGRHFTCTIGTWERIPRTPRRRGTQGEFQKDPEHRASAPWDGDLPPSWHVVMVTSSKVPPTSLF